MFDLTLTYALAGIETKYLPPTNTRGARVRARRTDHTKGDPVVTVPYDHGLSTFDAHTVAARALAERIGWSGEFTAAATVTGYVYARAYTT